MCSLVRTQKAKGVLKGIDCLMDCLYDIGVEYLFNNPAHKLIQEHSHISNIKMYPYFARPCPMTPRHGFINSKVVKDSKELTKLWHKILKHDKKGEIILGPYYPNVFENAIYVNNGNLSFGIGNDGATSGKNSISLPVSPMVVSSSLRKSSGLSKKDTIYLEAIRNKNQNIWNIVQLRGGPKIDSLSLDYIPKNMKIKHIEKPHNNLLKWENDVKNFKPGTIVYGPGHTLASHAAIHCVLNKIPFITSYKPKVGQVIRKTKKSSIKINRGDFKKGVKAGFNLCKETKHNNISPLFKYVISVLHNWAYLKNSEHAGWILGSACIILAKICLTLISGESRHSLFNNEFRKIANRSKIYNKMLHGSLGLFKKVPKIFKIFYYYPWAEGYGGTNWANCALYTNDIWTNIVEIYNGKSNNIPDRDISKIIGIINKTMNLAHNNGWWFDKVESPEHLDGVAKFPGLYALASAHIYRNIYKRTKSIKNTSKLLKSHSIIDPAYKKDNKRAWIVATDPHYCDGDGCVSIYMINEEDNHTCRDIDIGKEEYSALMKEYKKVKKSCLEQLVLPVNKNGLFSLYTSKKYNAKKVFGVK